MFGLIASIAAPVIGGLLGRSSANKAANAELQAAREGIASQEKMFEKGLALQAPYREAGYGAVTGLQGLLDPTQRADMLNQYYAGPEYAMMSKQLEEQQLRNMAATGNLRGGVGQNAMAGIAPALGMDYLSNRQGLLTGLANMGMGAAAQGSAQSNALGQNIAQAQYNMGQVRSNQAITNANLMSDMFGSLLGLVPR